MSEEAAGLDRFQPRAWIAGVALAAALGAAALSLPNRIKSTRDAFSLIRQHDGWNVASRSVLGAELHQALTAADSLLPHDAVVLLVTPGRDWRRGEYVAFHRVLYLLAPRPVWWASPATRDGSWESLWWYDIAPTLDATARRAQERKATHVLALGEVGWPLPGNDVRDLPGGGRLSTIDARQRSPGLSGGWRAAPSPAGVFPAIAVVMLAGWVLSRALVRQRERQSAAIGLALSWLLGAGVVSLAMFWMTWMGLPPRLQRFTVVGLTIAGTLWVVARHGVPKGVRLSRKVPLACGILTLWVIAELTGIFVRSVAGPLSGWDGWVTWAMKARVLYLEPGPSAFLMDASREISNRSYPLLVPLTEAWLYGWIGGADDRFAAVMTSCFLAALVVLLVSALHERLSCIFALGITVVFLATPYAGRLASLGYADVVVAAYAFAAALELRRLQDTPEVISPALAAVLLGLLPWVKPEGILLALALVVAALLSTPDAGLRRRVAGSSAIAIAVCAALWYLLVAAADLPQRVFNSAPVLSLDRIGVVVTGLLARAINADWLGIWIVAILAIGLSIARAKWRRLIPLAIVAYLACVAAVFMFSRYEPLAQHIVRSADRLLLHITPLALLMLAELFGNVSGRRPRASTEPATHRADRHSV